MGGALEFRRFFSPRGDFFGLAPGLFCGLVLGDFDLSFGELAGLPLGEFGLLPPFFFLPPSDFGFWPAAGAGFVLAISGKS